MPAPQYDAQVYARHRPTYPKELFDIIYQIHESHPDHQYELAVDLGCGTGITTSVIAPKFLRTIAVDPSQEMLNCINHEKITTILADAEAFKTQEVDLITISTAAHWFEMEKVYQNCFEMLKPSGTLAIWAYGHCQFPEPELTQAFEHYSTVTLGAYWDPRRGRLDRLYSDPDFIQSPFPIWNRQVYPDSTHPPLMTFNWTWETLTRYLKTWSPYKTFKAKHPEQDCVDEYIQHAKTLVQTESLQVVFPVVLITCKKS